MSQACGTWIACPCASCTNAASCLEVGQQSTGSLSQQFATVHCQDLLADSKTHAHACQHEQSSSALHASFDAAAKAAGLRRKQPCSGLPPVLTVYPWFGPRCAALRLQLRQAKCSLPCNPAVRLLERQEQSQLRHSRTCNNQKQVTEHCQRFSLTLSKCLQHTRLSHMQPSELQYPLAWAASSLPQQPYRLSFTTKQAPTSAAVLN